MAVLLDECLPDELLGCLAGFDTITAKAAGLKGKRNGELLRLMKGRFDVFITIDTNLEYQQNRKLIPSLIVLDVPDNSKETILALAPQVCKTLGFIKPGQIVHISAQPKRKRRRGIS